MTTKELRAAVGDVLGEMLADEGESARLLTLSAFLEASDALATHALALEAELAELRPATAMSRASAERNLAALTEAKARALEEAADAWECDEDHDASGRTCPQRWLRSRAALTAERTRREAAEKDAERLTVEDLPAAKAMTERVGAMYRAEVQRREAAERRADENAEALSALHDEIDDALPEYTCDAVGTAANHVERVVFAGRDLASLRERAEKAEAERDAVVSMASVLTEMRPDPMTAHLEAASLTARLAATERERDEARAEVKALREGTTGPGVHLASMHASYGAVITKKADDLDAALAALAEVVGAGAELRERLDSLDDEALDSPVRQADHWLGEVMRRAASPAALGAEVIARAEERGAAAMREACAVELRRMEDAYDARGVRGSYPADFSDRDKRDAMTHAADTITALDPAEVCKAARGAR